MEAGSLENLKLSQNCREGDVVFVSCESGEGIKELLQVIESKLGLTKKERVFLIPHDQYLLVIKTRKEGSLAKEIAEDNGVRMTAFPSNRLLDEIGEFEV